MEGINGRLMYAIRSGAALPRSEATSFLALINAAHQSSYSFVDLSMRIQKEACEEIIQDRLHKLNAIRRNYSIHASPAAITRHTQQLCQALTWFQAQDIALAYLTTSQRYILLYEPHALYI